MGVRITLPRIAELQCHPAQKQVFLRDSEVPGLSVRATAGSKSFVFESRLHGKTVRTTIGSVSHWTIERARERARTLRVLIDQGIDPREQMAELRETKRATQLAAEAACKATLRHLLDSYIDHLTNANKSAGSIISARSAFKCWVPEDAMSRPATSIRPEDVADWMRCCIAAGRERTASQLRASLNAAFNLAIRAPFDPRIDAAFKVFGAIANPCGPTPHVPRKAGNHTLSLLELRAYAAGLLTRDTVSRRLLLVSLLGGGQRLEQLARVPVSDWDDGGGVLTLYDRKGRSGRQPRTHKLPLAPIAAAIVRELVARAERLKSPWLFASAMPGYHHKYATPAQASETIRGVCKAIGAAHFDQLDLRRTCETQLAALGVSSDLRAQILSHALGTVADRHYQRHEFMAEKLAALRQWELHVMPAATHS